MAKKENKYIGYVALSVIPLIGIVWAFVAGKLHEGYVNKCITQEIDFETKFKSCLNELNLSSSTSSYVISNSPNNLDNLNITSIRPLSYDVHVDWNEIDDPNYPNKSFSIEIKANPILKVNDEDEQLFDLTYEFFVPFDVYEEFSSYYNKDFIQTVGTEEYTYLTYYKNNPRNCPIVGLIKYFDSYYKNIAFYEYKNEIIVGNSSSVVINLIDEIDEDSITYLSKTDLTKINNLYNLLTNSEKLNVTNYLDLEKYIGICDAKVTENLIDGIKKTYENGEVPSDISVEDCRASYNKLNEVYKVYVLNYSTLEEIEFKLPYLKFMKYYNKIDGATGKTKYNSIKTAVTNYNKLTSDLRVFVSQEVLDQLNLYVQEYNDDPDNKTKLSLK